MRFFGSVAKRTKVCVERITIKNKGSILFGKTQKNPSQKAWIFSFMSARDDIIVGVAKTSFPIYADTND